MSNTIPLPEPAPSHSLPDWGECALRVGNSNFTEKRQREGGYGPEPDSMLATQLHRFIYEYDDSDPYRSAWFMHRLELMLVEHAAAVTAAKDAEIAGLREDVERWRNGAEVWRESAEKFGAKCEQLQPVFDAACKYADAHRAMVAVCFDAEIGEGDILAEELNLSLAEAQLKLATDAARAALGDKTPNVRANRPVEAEGRNGSELSE